MPRWYCVQAANCMIGWVDLPELASMKKLEADRWAREFAKKKNVVTRTIRKPHGWEPPVQESAPSDEGDLTIISTVFEDEPPVILDPEESPKRARKHEKKLRNRPPTWHARIVGKDLF